MGLFARQARTFKTFLAVAKADTLAASVIRILTSVPQAIRAAMAQLV